MRVNFLNLLNLPLGVLCFLLAVSSLASPHAIASGVKLNFDASSTVPVGDGSYYYQDADGVRIQCSDNAQDLCGSVTGNQITSANEYSDPNLAPSIVLEMAASIYTISSLTFTATVDGSAPGSYYWYEGDGRTHYGVLQPGSNVVEIKQVAASILYMGVSSGNVFHNRTRYLGIGPVKSSPFRQRPKSVELAKSSPVATTVPIHLSDVYVNYSPPVIQLGGDFTTNNADITVTATRTDGGTPPLINYIWTLTVPDGSTVTVPANSNSNQLSLHLDKPGNYVFTARAYDGAFYSNIASQTISFLPSTQQISFTPSAPQVAQSVFLDSSINTLVVGKPVVAQVSVSQSGQFSSLNNSVAVMGTFRDANGASYQVVGCFPANAISASTPSITVNLFERLGSHGLPTLMGPISFSVQVNPSGTTSGILAGSAGCADTSVDFSPNISQTFVNSTLSFASTSSTDIALNFWELRPICTQSNCIYPNVSDLENFKNEETALLSALYPIAPNQVNSSHKDSWYVVGDGGNEAYKIKRSQQACPQGYNDRANCFWDYATVHDLTKVRDNGLRAFSALQTPSKNPRFVGVVPKSQGSILGYFGYLNQLLGGQHPQTKGLHHASVPDAVLIEEDFWMGVPHEIGHSFFLNFNNSADRLHQRVSVRDTGYWVAMLSAGQELLKPSFMISAFSETNPPSGHWMDRDTYKQLLTNMASRRSAVQILDQDQIFLSGVVNDLGNFVVVDAASDIRAGQTVGLTNQILEFSVRDPSGAEVSHSIVPLDFEILAEGEDTPLRTSHLAAVSTGIPFPTTGMSVVATASLGRGKSPSISTTFFPTIEMLRTSLDNIPESAFSGTAPDQYGALSNLLNEAESSLKQGDFVGAGNIISEKYAPLAITALRGDFVASSPSETDLRTLSDSVKKVAAAFKTIAQTFPATSNGLIRVVPSNEHVSPAGKVTFKIIQLTKPENPKYEFDFKVQLDGMEQAGAFSQDRDWTYQTPKLSAGTHLVNFQAVAQNRQAARTIREGIRNVELQLFERNQELARETDPEKITEIRQKIEELEVEISRLNERLNEIRSPIGTSIAITLTAS